MPKKQTYSEFVLSHTKNLPPDFWRYVRQMLDNMSDNDHPTNLALGEIIAGANQMRMHMLVHEWADQDAALEDMPIIDQTEFIARISESMWNMWLNPSEFCVLDVVGQNRRVNEAIKKVVEQTLYWYEANRASNPVAFSDIK